MYGLRRKNGTARIRIERESAKERKREATKGRSCRTRRWPFLSGGVVETFPITILSRFLSFALSRSLSDSEHSAPMREASQRQRRVQELLVHEISDIVRREVKDPRVSLVTVTDAEVSPDLRNARLFVSSLGGPEQTAEALKGLQSAAGFIRGEFARRARLRFTP